MERTIYADVLFAVNFSMDFLALYITAFFIRCNFKFKRAIASAVIGGIYGIIVVVLDIGVFLTAVFTVMSAVIMCLILSGFNDVLSFARQLVIFLVVNMAIGGGMTAIYSWFNTFGAAHELLIYGEANSISEQLPLALFVIGGVVIGVILTMFGRIFSSKRKLESAVICISYGGRTIELQAMVDSGDLLTEPFSGQAVAVIDKEAAEKLLSKNMLALLSSMQAVGGVEYPIKKIRFLVCETISGKKTLGAFKPDKITVNDREVAAWVAISDGEAIRSIGDNNAIVPSVLVTA